MRLLYLVVGALIILAACPYASAKDWRGIVPLKSTKADVERLLGPSTGDPPRYYLSENTVYFSYAECGCSEKCQNNNWNVPPGTVILIRVGVKGVVKLADLSLDLTRFQKLPGDDDVPGSFVYVDKEDGFAVEGGGAFVSALIYMPSAKDDRLRCPRKSADGYRLLRRGITNETGVFKIVDGSTVVVYRRERETTHGTLDRNYRRGGWGAVTAHVEGTLGAKWTARSVSVAAALLTKRRT